MSVKIMPFFPFQFLFIIIYHFVVRVFGSFGTDEMYINVYDGDDDE